MNIFKSIKSFFMKPNIPKEFLPIEVVAYEHDISVRTLKSYFYKNYLGKKDRFLKLDDKYYVHKNYKYLFAQKLDTLRQKALILAHTENNLCKELSKISGKNQTTITKYFYRFTFKQIKQSKEMIHLLETYIKQNSLFSIEELNYD